MVSIFRGRERRGVRVWIVAALICALAASGCSSKTLHSDGAGGSKHTASGGESGSAGGESAAESGGSGDPGSGGSQGGNFGSGGRERPSGGNFGAGGLGRGSGGNLGAGGSRQGGGAGGTGIASGGTAGTHADAGVIPERADPTIPAVTADCPKFVSGMISFMGLDGIQLDVGTKPAEAKAPMLFYWHGTASTSGEYLTMAAPIASGILDARGVIVSFQGTTGGDLYSLSSIFGVGDLVLADQLVACAVRDANVDPRRIYTMGCSSGGFFSIAMAALRSSYIAAAAPNSGGQTVDPAFQNAHTPPLMTVHEAAGSSAGIIDFVAASAAADKTFKDRGGFVIDCDTGRGHCGGSPLAPDVWQFFLAHPFGVDPEPWTAALPPSFSTLCKIQ
jgi:acetyl esterase/lipase